MTITITWGLFFTVLKYAAIFVVGAVVGVFLFMWLFFKDFKVF